MKLGQAKLELRFSKKLDEDGNGMTMLESSSDCTKNCSVIVCYIMCLESKLSKSRNLVCWFIWGKTINP